MVHELHAVRLFGIGFVAGYAYDVPGAARQVVLEVDHGFFAAEFDLLSVEGPRAEAHLAELFVEWKVANVDGA